MAGADTQSTTHGAIEVGQQLPAVVDLVDDALGAGQKGLPGFGQLDAPPTAMKQRRAEMALQRRDSFTHGRLGDVDALCGA